jgi:hypothetical protein
MSFPRIPRGIRVSGDFYPNFKFSICGFDYYVAKQICDLVGKALPTDQEPEIKLQLNDNDIKLDDSEENKTIIPLTNELARLCYILTNYGEEYRLFDSIYNIRLTRGYPEDDTEIALVSHGVGMVMGKTPANPRVCAKLGWSCEDIEAFSKSITLEKVYNYELGYMMVFYELYMASPQDFVEDLANGKAKFSVLRNYN